jgi:hypothetical protein
MQDAERKRETLITLAIEVNRTENKPEKLRGELWSIENRRNRGIDVRGSTLNTSPSVCRTVDFRIVIYAPENGTTVRSNQFGHVPMINQRIFLIAE